MPFFERRKYPRIAEILPCRIQAGSAALVAQTKNISCGGILCHLSRPLSPMTKLEIVLNLPPLPGLLARAIRCVGVVVRQDPPAGGEMPYLTAIYFSEIAVEDRRRIAEFVLQSMLSHDRRRS